MPGAAILFKSISPPPSDALALGCRAEPNSPSRTSYGCFVSYYSGSCSVTLQRESQGAGMFWATTAQLPCPFSEQDNHAQEEITRDR